MHFWSGNASLSGYGRNQRICNSYFPKPMVTPVHRFQAIESVANNGLRYARSPGYHPRLQYPHTNLRTSHHHHQQNETIIGANHFTIPSRRRNRSPKTKWKCGVCIFFAVNLFFLAFAKYYFNGINIGAMEALIFCTLLLIVFIIGGLVSLCQAMGSYASSNSNVNVPTIVAQLSTQLNEPETPPVNHNHNHNQVPSVVTPEQPDIPADETPPPPYHIAIMISPPSDANSVDREARRDSPPPTYEKAVT